MDRKDPGTDVLGWSMSVTETYPVGKPRSVPHQLPSGQWNCSVSYWPDFKHHLLCNQNTECAERQDEAGCPSCDKGGIRLLDKCYNIVQLPVSGSRVDAPAACIQRNSTLAILSNHHYTHDFLACDSQVKCWFEPRPSLGQGWNTDGTGADVEARCREVTGTSLTALFACSTHGTLVPYSLVCDHRQDCQDNSDEDFCVYPTCLEFSQYQCENRQCIALLRACDGVLDCYDESDETSCEVYVFTEQDPLLLPLLVDFDGKGNVNSSTIDRYNVSAACPDTHFVCPGGAYCLPVYVVCNVVYDCPGHEDEAACDSYSCPGFYRCRGALATCLHPKHLCDGWPQCPQQDDERFCDLACPQGCTCLGHAFKCDSDFPVELYARVRYLDATGSGMSAGRLWVNSLLVYLRLSACNLTNLDNFSLPNLGTLDLSDNKLTVFPVNVLSKAHNLKTLSLARNPLLKFMTEKSSLSYLDYNIMYLDMSGVEIQTVHVRDMLPFFKLVSLNLTNSRVSSILDDGFQSLAYLEVLDVRGCPMVKFPKDIFSGLNNLKSVEGDNYKLCCPATLPIGFDMVNCKAPSNEVSSCDSLLRSDIYRVCLATLAALAIIGNLGCFFMRVFSIESRTKSGFNVFVIHLCGSDFLMGLYLSIIGMADYIYRGTYLWEDSSWRSNVACKIAGFLSLASNEISAIIISLITLDRFLAIRFPFNHFHFGHISAQVACSATWVGGVFIAAFPLLPVTARWEFYSQTGICIPLPITRNEFPGHQYAFGVMVVFNMILFVFIAMGQAFIYQSMTSSAITSTDTSRRSRDVIVARRLLTVVLSDFCCWFPIGLLGLLAARGVPVSGEINMGIAIFVLPLNSTLNPFLYTVNMLQEKRRKAAEERLLRMIMLQKGRMDKE